MGFEPIICVRLVPVLKAIMTGFPANIYFLKVNNRNTRKEICSKLTKTPEQSQWPEPGPELASLRFRWKLKKKYSPIFRAFANLHVNSLNAKVAII